MKNSFIIKLLRPIKYRIDTYKLIRPYSRYIEKNIASLGISQSREKQRAYILMQAHIIEKGLSLADVKPWFGQPKIKALINSVKNYYNKYGDKKVLYFVVSMLQSYFDFNSTNEGAPIELMKDFGELKELLGDFQDKSLDGGVVVVNKQDNYLTNFDYELFAASRHSVRSFTGEPIDVEKLRRALRIAETTPSACNRQPWYNYVVTDKTTVSDILTIQRGSRQFKDQVSALIITTSSAHFFFGDEYNQMYYNTGLYAMNLLFALHSEGLGTIPLNMGLSKSDLEEISKICGIPDAEMPISLIAIGLLPESFKYAKSARFSYKDYTKFV